MTSTALYIWSIAAALAFVIAVAGWYRGSIYGTEAWKGRALLSAHLFGGAGICIGALMFVSVTWRLPVLEAEGGIEAVKVHGGKSTSSDVFIHTLSGEDIAVYADGTSPYFRKGEHLRVRYEEKTRHIVKAWFIGADGKREGVFLGTPPWVLSLFVLAFGILVILVGFRKYRRDSGGAKDT